MIKGIQLNRLDAFVFERHYMKKFSYFLFENFDADFESENPGNPRRIINAQADAILSQVADFSPLTCSATQLRDEFGIEAVNQLITAGALCEKDGQIAYDTPIFLAEDVPALKSFASTAAAPLADRLWELRDRLWDIVKEINNGFDPQRNLYHILCGMIFDGFSLTGWSREVSSQSLGYILQDWITFL